MAKSFIERLREQREKRIAANKATVNNEQREFLNTEHLPKGVKTWWAKEGQEVRFRLLPFLVTQENNCAGEAVGSFGNVRRFKVHYMPNGRVVVCPKSFGGECPLCETFYNAPEADQKNRKSPVYRLKPKDRALFNALFEVPSEDGSTKQVLRVVNAGYFASWGKLMDEIKDEAGLKQNLKRQDEIYNYDDPENGYWIEARCNKASISGNEKDAFMQFTKVSLEWKAKTEPVSDKVLERLADLDLLIPEPPTAEELRKSMGLTPAVEEAPEHEDDDTSDENEDVVVEEEIIEEPKKVAVKKVKKAPAPVVEEEPEDEEIEDLKEEPVAEEPAIEDEAEADDGGFDDDDFDF
jgi:hypothetical protein